MTGTVRKVWLWFKLVVVLLVVTWVTLFFVFNRNYTTPVWVFPISGLNGDHQTSLDLIIPITAVLSVAGFYSVRMVVKLWHQVTDMRSAQRQSEQQRKMENLARQVEQKLGPGKDESASRD